MDRKTIEYDIELRKTKIKKLEDFKVSLTNSVNKFAEKYDSVFLIINEINAMLDYSKDTMISPAIKEKNTTIISTIKSGIDKINNKETEILLKVDKNIDVLKKEINYLNNELSEIEE